MCIFISLIGIGLFLKSKTSFVISSQVTLSINLRERGDLVSGIYFIETRCNKQTNVQKLVKK
jgi:hypothetical protein